MTTIMEPDGNNDQLINITTAVAPDNYLATKTTKDGQVQQVTNVVINKVLGNLIEYRNHIKCLNVKILGGVTGKWFKTTDPKNRIKNPQRNKYNFCHPSTNYLKWKKSNIHKTHSITKTVKNQSTPSLSHIRRQ